eukprot:2331890-Rhodomonas_salina.1
MISTTPGPGPAAGQAVRQCHDSGNQRVKSPRRGAVESWPGCILKLWPMDHPQKWGSRLKNTRHDRNG